VPLHRRIQRAIAGAPRSLEDKGLHHKVTLVALLAWVGLGADGLSSSAYGPDEAFRTVGSHIYLAVPLAILTAVTVFIISAGYSRIIEDFPHGGGGYVVATKLLGEKAGVVSGCALLVDYVLTVTVSIAAAGDALFSLSFIPPEMQAWKLSIEVFLIVLLLVLNVRGVRESIIALTPIFFLFVLTHLAVILGGRLVASGTTGEIRDMVDAMPSEIRIRCDAPRRLAEAVCGTVGAESVRFEGDDLLVVGTRQPRVLAERIAHAAVEDRLAIEEVMAGDRSLEGIFGRLVRLHRGVGS
jgi:hypothetical protein